jgi:hypothetical protein
MGSRNGESGVRREQVVVGLAVRPVEPVEAPLRASAT